jgi:hypothetical protein
MSRNSSRKKKAAAAQRNPLLERINPAIAMGVAVLTLVVAAATLMHTWRRDLEQERIDARRHVVETVKDLIDEDSTVVAPIADHLARLGDTATAQTLVASVTAKHRGEQRLDPVILPEHRDSADAALARAAVKVRAQEPLPAGLVDPSVLADGQRPLHIEVVQIPRDSPHAVLPSGDIVERAELGGLWEDGYGRLTCGGECRDPQACCRIVVAPGSASPVPAKP